MSQTKRAYDKFLLYALLIIALGVVGFISATTVIDPGYLNTTGPVLGSTGTFTGAVSGTSGSFSAALTGTTLDTGQGANELFDMDQNVLQASAVTFSTVNTGQGANELYDMDQNVMATSSVTFDDVAITDNITIGGITRTTWPQGADFTILHGYTAYVGFDVNKSGFDNYFYCDGVDDNVEIQTALDYCAAIEDSYTVFFEIGIYDVDGTLTLAAGDEIILRGVGKSGSGLTSGGGSVLDFNSDCQLLGLAGSKLETYDMTFNFDGTFTKACIDMWTNDCHWDSYNCLYRIGATVANGNSGNAISTPTGVCILLGKSGGGPVGVPFTWIGNKFVDQRKGASTYNALFAANPEEMIFSGTFIYVDFAASLQTPSMFYISPVNHATISDFGIFTTVAWDTSAVPYHKQFSCSGANKNFSFDGVQLLDATETTYNFYTNSGNMYVEATWLTDREGGATEVDPTLGGSGTVHVRGTTPGWHSYGPSTIAIGANTTGNIAHGLLGIPTMVTFTGTTADSSEIWCNSTDATNVVGMVDGVVAAERVVYYDFWYTKTG